MSDPKAVKQITASVLKAVSKSRQGSVWVNKKRYPKHKCSGHFMVFRGQRVFILADCDKGIQHEFQSPEAAKAWGWVKIA